MKLNDIAMPLLALSVFMCAAPAKAVDHRQVTALNVKHSVSLAAAGLCSHFTALPFVLNDDSEGAGLQAKFINLGGRLVLSLRKLAPTAANSSVGAFILGVNGVTPTVVGYDFQTANSWSGPIDPYFNLGTTDGVLHQTVGSMLGTQTVLGNGYTRVTFDPSNSSQTFPVVTGGERLSTLTLVMYTGPDGSGGTGPAGYAIINNIQLNNVVTGKSPHTDIVK